MIFRLVNDLNIKMLTVSTIQVASLQICGVGTHEVRELKGNGVFHSGFQRGIKIQQQFLPFLLAGSGWACRKQTIQIWCGVSQLISSRNVALTGMPFMACGVAEASTSSCCTKVLSTLVQEDCVLPYSTSDETSFIYQIKFLLFVMVRFIGYRLP